MSTRNIPRTVLFGNPDRNMVSISPDCEKIAWLAPHGRVPNIWVAPRLDLHAARPVTNDTKRGIHFFIWAYTNTHILFFQDDNLIIFSGQFPRRAEAGWPASHNDDLPFFHLLIIPSFMDPDDDAFLSSLCRTSRSSRRSSLPGGRIAGEAQDDPADTIDFFRLQIDEHGEAKHLPGQLFRYS